MFCICSCIWMFGRARHLNMSVAYPAPPYQCSNPLFHPIPHHRHHNDHHYHQHHHSTIPILPLSSPWSASQWSYLTQPHSQQPRSTFSTQSVAPAIKSDALITCGRSVHHMWLSCTSPLHHFTCQCIICTTCGALITIKWKNPSHFVPLSQGESSAETKTEKWSTLVYQQQQQRGVWGVTDQGLGWCNAAGRFQSPIHWSSSQHFVLLSALCSSCHISSIYSTAMLWISIQQWHVSAIQQGNNTLYSTHWGAWIYAMYIFIVKYLCTY